MSRKQLQGIAEPLSLPKPTPKTTPRPKTCTPTTPTPAQILKNCTSTPVARPEKPISIPNEYKPKNIAGNFDNKYMELQRYSDEKSTFKKYLENIRSYLWGMTDDLKTSGDWKIHLKMKRNFVSTTGSIEY